MSKVKTLNLPETRGLSFHMASSEFDSIVDGGFDVIVIVTPARRYVSNVDDWQDYGYYDLEVDEEIIVLNKSYMSS